MAPVLELAQERSGGGGRGAQTALASPAALEVVPQTAAASSIPYGKRRLVECGPAPRGWLLMVVLPSHGEAGGEGEMGGGGGVWWLEGKVEQRRQARCWTGERRVGGWWQRAIGWQPLDGPFGGRGWMGCAWVGLHSGATRLASQVGWQSWLVGWQASVVAATADPSWLAGTGSDRRGGS